MLPADSVFSLNKGTRVPMPLRIACLVALLWGAKNNQHRGNSFKGSGQIKVEQQLQQTLMY